MYLTFYEKYVILYLSKCVSRKVTVMKKFVPYEKLSKKKKKEINNKKRNTWGDMNPQPRIISRNFKKLKQMEYEDSLDY